MIQVLYGFKMEILFSERGNFTRYHVSELNIVSTEALKRKKLLFKCNGFQDEIDLTETENEFVEKIYEYGIDRLEETYPNPMFWFNNDEDFSWELDYSFDDKHVVSSGGSIPNEIWNWIPYLRQIGMSFPLSKPKHCSK